MKKIISSLAFAVLLVLTLSFPVLAKNAAVKGVANDPNADWLGDMTYLGNKAGYHFWFTSQKTWSPWYTEGHSYHNVYKVKVSDPTEWCGTTVVPNRKPYNLVGHTGETVYFKVFDITDDVEVCPY